MNSSRFITHGLALLLSIFMLQPTLAASSAHHVRSDADYQRQILFYVNAYRAKHHLRALTMNPLISAEAATHSRDMARHANGISHNGFNGRIKRLYHHIKQANGGAENVAYYRLSPKQLVDAWMASAGHRHNILGPYHLTGIGIAHGKKGWAYFTQIFLRTDHSSAKRKRFSINLM